MGTIAKMTLGGATHLIASTAYGTCATAAATAAKVATIQDSQAFTLITGATIHIKFTYANGVANPTLNVNSTGAIKIYRYGTTAPSTSAATSWNAGAVVSFTYDGTNWIMNDWINDNTTSTVNQAAVITTNGEYCLIHANNTGTATKSASAVYKSSATINPSTGQITMKGKPVLYGDYSESTAPSSPVTGQLWLKKATMTLEEAKVLVVSTTVSSLPTTISNSSITADMELLKGELSNPQYQASDITVTTAAGSATISGTLIGSTTIKLWLMRGR